MDRYPQPSCDVAVVGAGPVGQTLAVLLGLRGWRVQLFEVQVQPYPFPRAVHLDHQAARILQVVGVMDDLMDRSEIMDAYEWRSAGGATLLRLEADAAAGALAWPASIMFCQPDLERLLAARVARLPNVGVNRGWEVTGLADHGDRVQVEAAAGVGPTASVSARWVVGCDGARSSTRRLLGVAVTDFDYRADWLILDVLPHESTPWRPLNLQLCDPGRPTAAVSGGRGRRRFEFMRLPTDSVEQLSSSDFAWRLLERWGFTPLNATLERSALYRFGACVAQRWRDGRVLLAGDAAHQMPPFAGQGLCSGLRDAANLSWKLDAVLAGVAPPDLIDTYPSERAPQVQAEIDFSIEVGKIVCLLDPEEAAARDSAMAAAAQESGPIPPPVLPPLGPGLTYPGDEHTGELAIQGVVAKGGLSGRFDDIMGSAGRWVLISVGDPPSQWLGAEEAEWFATLGGVICHLAPDAVVDTEGAYAAWLHGLSATVVLQRPDFSVFGTAGDPAAANALLGAARLALRADAPPPR